MPQTDPLQSFITRKLAGESAPLEDNVPFTGDDPRYRAALAAEAAYDAAEEDEELEAEDFDPTALENHTMAAALAMGFGPSAEEVAEAQPLDDDEDEETESQPAEGLPADVLVWWNQLSEAQADRIRAGTAEELRAAYEQWAAQNAGDEAEDDRGYEPEGPLPRTGAEFVEWAQANADGIREQFDMDPDQYVAAMARANAAEWRRIANASGIPFEAKPSYSQIGPRGQTELLRADLEDAFAKMEREGRHIE